jgi:hypothetical protein
VIHQSIGRDNLQLLAKPGIGSLTREVMAQYTAEQVYSTARQEIQDKIRSLAEDRLGEKMMEREGGDAPYRVSLRDTVILYDTLVQSIELPALVVNAINRKTEQYYISEEYKFRVEREKRESERKKIEAEGIREFQMIVSQGISDSYLRWRGIEATLQLAQSTNSKVVVIGSAKDGLPLILGNMDTPPAQSTSAPTPNDGGSTPRETTAAGPAVPLEKTPAAGLTKPTEKMPAAESSSAGASTAPTGAPKPAAAAPEPARSLFPITLRDIEALFARAIRPAEPKNEAPAKPSSPTPPGSGAPIAEKQAR